MAAVADFRKHNFQKINKNVKFYMLTVGLRFCILKTVTKLYKMEACKGNETETLILYFATR
jgi:hypothetical protein